MNKGNDDTKDTHPNGGKEDGGKASDNLQGSGAEQSFLGAVSLASGVFDEGKDGAEVVLSGDADNALDTEESKDAVGDSAAKRKPADRRKQFLLSVNTEEDKSLAARTGYLGRLYAKRQRERARIHKALTIRHLEFLIKHEDLEEGSSENDQATVSSRAEASAHATQLSNRVKQIAELCAEWGKATKGQAQFATPCEVRMKNFTCSVTLKPGSHKVQTVYNSSFLYIWKKWYERTIQHKEDPDMVPQEKFILRNINLLIEPGKNYLVLGAPGSGKTTLLQAISGHIKLSPRKRRNKGRSITGSILYNGRSLTDGEKDDIFIENAVTYIDQLDNHAPRLTVRETLDFAYQCKAGRTWFRDKDWCSPEQLEILKKYDQENVRVNSLLVGLGLDGVADTFVGNNQVRGVSGGQRRRVTVGEMLGDRVPVLCGDEISTGLDATSTFEMCEMLTYFGQSTEAARVISLLQPSPETVSLFDEVILLSAGRVIYAGPIIEVQEYFHSLGFKAPGHMDVADYLQQISTDGGAEFYHPPTEELKKQYPDPPTPEELASFFEESEHARRIQEKLSQPSKYTWNKEEGEMADGTVVSRLADMKAIHQRYANNPWRSTILVCKRFITLWLRDKRVIMAASVKNILMGVSVGGVFANNMDPIDISGALFQAGLFIMLGAMQSASTFIIDKEIYRKHAKNNFYSAIPFVLGRTLSTVPQVIYDVVVFGTLLYYVIGLAGRNSAPNFFIYLTNLMFFAFTMQQQLAVFASFSTASGVQGYSSVVVLFFTLFGGYIMAPDIVPDFYIWIYWVNPFAWVYRALVLNEFSSARWGDNTDQILRSLGFTSRLEGETFDETYIYWSYVYMGIYFILCTGFCALGLSVSSERTTSKALQIADGDQSDRESMPDEGDIQIPFIPVNLSFHDITYDVKASTGKNKLRLLNGVSGIFRPGRMCALMGTSGAGKTTLMDVIALRKRTGEVGGEIRINGWKQDPVSFPRCSGYVYQFDVQSPELTVKETVLFSAKLRLDLEKLEHEDDVYNFVDQVIKEVNLTKIRHALVGTDDGMGLTFEQKKLLSIAVELAAAPSVIFLDEPTSGLDSRSALLVGNTLRKIANGNRTVVATIHQPSSTVFELFDELLLLKRGGHVVFHGNLGKHSSMLVNYFHSQGAPEIGFGENPADWMLKVMAKEEMSDLEERWTKSEEFEKLKQELDQILTNDPEPEHKVEYETEFAAPFAIRQKLVSDRLRLIYWRSPTYNLTRLLVSALIAFIMGSVYILQRHETNFSESEINSRFAVIFLSFIIIGVMAILSVIPIMTKIRDMFHRHRASGLYDSAAIGWALGSAEKIFIVLSSAIFVVVFQGTGSVSDNVFRGTLGFWGFFTFNFAIYSYFGQLFVCLVEPQATAIILSSVFIGLNNFFSGLIVRPQLMDTGFYALPYYIAPGHYVYEGMIVTLYREDNTVVSATNQSDFYYYLGCDVSDTWPCSGSTNDYIDFYFGGQFNADHISRNAVILGGVLVITRLVTWIALKYIRFG